MEQEGGELVETVVWLAAVGDLVWYEWWSPFTEGMEGEGRVKGRLAAAMVSGGGWQWHSELQREREREREREWEDGRKMFLKFFRCNCFPPLIMLSLVKQKCFRFDQDFKHPKHMKMEKKFSGKRFYAKKKCGLILKRKFW